MSPSKYLKVTLALALAGVAFSGYLSATKLLTGTCAFNESCPYFLGYPACWYGFVMFLALAVVTARALMKKGGQMSTSGTVLTSTAIARKAAIVNRVISTVGIIFAGRFVLIEVARWVSSSAGSSYGLVLPTCVYGLVFYCIIFVLSFGTQKSRVSQG